MSDEIKVGDQVSWLHTYRLGTQRRRVGKLVTISGGRAYVRTRRDAQPVMVALDKLTKVQPQEDTNAS